MNKLVKDALVLTLITVVAGCALGAVYEITKAPIAKASEEATQAAYKEVFAEAASFEDYEEFDEERANQLISSKGYTDDEIDNVVVACDDAGETLGYVITVTSHAGYGGDIVFSMGVTKDGVLNGYSITEISETAGLGMKAKEPAFADQFKNKKAGTLEVIKQGEATDTQIEAISGATITSSAVTNGINAGFVYFSSIEGGNANE